jgi:hypothetical protein
LRHGGGEALGHRAGGEQKYCAPASPYLNSYLFSEVEDKQLTSY